MYHVLALIIKFLMITAVLELIICPFFGITFGNTLWISLTITGAAYLIGDLWILPRFGNVNCTFLTKTSSIADKKGRL
ncbi:DUF2512 family protein [Natribacillus halophilus]|uniref:Uncharacterized protein n=1 Tax=Natribacillus halophilus TaxID=549003 RepID=A0A1G8ML93_9BACI|nr:Protein of unknown function [Natribacillus halophilus]